MKLNSLIIGGSSLRRLWNSSEYHDSDFNHRSTQVCTRAYHPPPLPVSTLLLLEHPHPHSSLKQPYLKMTLWHLQCYFSPLSRWQKWAKLEQHPRPCHMVPKAQRKYIDKIAHFGDQRNNSSSYFPTAARAIQRYVMRHISNPLQYIPPDILQATPISKRYFQEGRLACRSCVYQFRTARTV